jgi:VanZ family protein
MRLVFRWLQQNGSVLAAVWLVAIAVATLAPAKHLPLVPGGDKLHHLAAYGVLMFLASLPKRRVGTLLVLLALAIAFGGAVELIQPYINRAGEWADFVANTAGACIGCGSALLLRAGLSRRQSTLA